MRRRAARAVVLVGLVALAVGGCGDSADDPDVDPTTSVGSSPSAGTDSEAPAEPAPGSPEELVATASDAVRAIIQRDYRTYDDSVDAALPLLTDDFAESFAESTDTVRTSFVAAQTVVIVTVTGAAVTGTTPETESGGQVLVFFTQSSVKGDTPGQDVGYAVLVDLVTVDGRLLVSQLSTDPTSEAVALDRDQGAVVDAAGAFATAFVNIGYQDLERDEREILDLATGDFVEEFSSAFADLSQALTDGQSTQTGEVVAVGVVPGSTDDEAEALVALTGKVTNVDAPQGTARSYRLRIDLTRVDGAWLADDVAFVG